MNLLVSSLQDSMFFLTNGPVELYKQPGVIISPFVSIFGLILDYIFRGVEAVFTSGTLGVSIILFTIISRILLLPLAAYQTKAMMKMKVLQPDIKKVQEKYKGKNDIESKQKMQAEISEVQKKHGASPLAGCLPLLIQMPTD